MNNFVFYKSFWEAIESLPNDMEKLKAYQYIAMYGITWDMPSQEQSMAYTIFIMAKPNIDNAVKKKMDGKKGWAPMWNKNAEKTRNSGTTWQIDIKQPVVDLQNNQWLKNETSYIDIDIDIEKENKKESEFELFWKEYPHARKWKKKDSKMYFSKQNPHDVMKQVAILKRKIKAWLQDAQYVPACERWIRDFTPLSEDVVRQDLVKICKWHLNCGWDIKQRASELKETFGEQQINEIVKEIQQKDSPKNLFLKQQ